MFIDAHPAPPTLVIFGAVHYRHSRCPSSPARAGFRVRVVDARAQLCTKERFPPDAEQLLVAWPDEVAGDLEINASTYIAILTHDDKFDEPALAAALNSPARYIGAIGSRRTHSKRVARLQADGISDEQVARVRGPIGPRLGQPNGRGSGVERLGGDDRGAPWRQRRTDEPGAPIDRARVHSAPTNDASCCPRPSFRLPPESRCSEQQPVHPLTDR